MTTQTYIGRKIRRAREQANYTRSEFAQESAISVGRLARIESGKTQPRDYEVVAVEILTGQLI